MKLKTLLIIFIVALMFTSCADVTNIDACTKIEPYGFWSGLWHGIVSPFSFFGSLFSDDIAIYAVNNNGGWYDLGFVLGSGILFSSAAKSY
jgi:hypothetical protein